MRFDPSLTDMDRMLIRLGEYLEQEYSAKLLCMMAHSGLLCTRMRGHDGPHVASGAVPILAWRASQDEPSVIELERAVYEANREDHEPED